MFLSTLSTYLLSVFCCCLFHFAMLIFFGYIVSILLVSVRKNKGKTWKLSDPFCKRRRPPYSTYSWNQFDIEFTFQIHVKYLQFYIYTLDDMSSGVIDYYMSNSIVRISTNFEFNFSETILITTFFFSRIFENQNQIDQCLCMIGDGSSYT